MGRVGRTSVKQRSNRPLRKKIGDSSDSDEDEDYVAEIDEQSDDMEFLGEALEEESCFEEEDGKEGGWRTVVKPKPKTKPRTKLRTKPRTKPKPKPQAGAKKGISRPRNNGVNRPNKRRKVTSHDDEDDSGSDESDDDDDDDDVEFTPDEFEYLEEEDKDDEGEEEEDGDEDDDDDEELPKEKTKKRGRTTRKRKKPGKSQRSRGTKASRKPAKKRRKRSSSSRKVANFVDDEEFMEKSPSPRGRTRKYPLRRKKLVIDESNSEYCSDSSRYPLRRKKLVIDESNSESCSDSSDCEFTISEEEMEQIREANVICRTVATDLRSSRKNQKDVVFCEPKKPPARKKGKEKVAETKNDIGKPVCGICLTEEGKTTVPGTLNCCSHYFCFACIMEWSKVETRCPLCKQRFVTISKPTKCGKGFDLRNSMVTVPERDQVYQPSEEELRDFLNPYENVICTECNQGGDDALMLLCDVCDSPAHTYCVGLGREVPEGNWYCDGCRPAALASLSQAQDLVRDQRSGAGASDRQSSIYENMAEIDLNVSIPETPLSHGDGFSSPRFSGGNFQVPSPLSGMGVSTVFGRRRIHRQIRHILSNRLSQNGGEISSLGNMMGYGVNTSPFHSSRTDEGTSHHAHGGQSTDFGYSRQTFPAIDGSTHPHRAWGGLESINLGASQVPLLASVPLMGPDTGGFSSRNWEGEHTNSVGQEVHSIVRNQVQRMSRDMNLGHNTCLEITRRSVHTIMAAYGLEPRRHDTYSIQPPICVHLLNELGNAETSPLNGCCLACFRNFVEVVVERMITDITMAPHWHFLRH